MCHYWSHIFSGIFFSFFAVATNCTNETNIGSVYLLISLSFLDAYG